MDAAQTSPSPSAAAHALPAGRTVVRVWLALLALTGAEVALARAGVRGGPMLALLLAMSVVKVWLILAWFMHLRFERRTLGWVVLPAVVVCILLLLFIVPDSVRLNRLSDAGSREAVHAPDAK